MERTRFHVTSKLFDRKAILKIKDRICETSNELLSSSLFDKVLANAIKELEQRKSIMLQMFPHVPVTQQDIDLLKGVLKYLTKMPLKLIPNLMAGAEKFVENKDHLFQFIEYLYNYWRHYDRFIICDAAGDPLDERPFRTFNNTIETLTHLVRGVYRDIQENITGDHPNVYRQVRAGAEIATIALPKQIPLPSIYSETLVDVPVIRQVLLNPPLVLYQPMNKRTGQFVKVVKNPMEHVAIAPDEWLCYPAKVGNLVILAYFHESFYELGFSLSNLFESMIKAQGGDPEITPADIKVGPHVSEMRATVAGHVVSVENKEINRIAKIAGCPASKGAGIVIEAKIGAKVNVGDVIFRIYSDNENRLKEAVEYYNAHPPHQIGGMTLERV